eukprot:843332-Rhodomonas_salina.1
MDTISCPRAQGDSDGWEVSYESTGIALGTAVRFAVQCQWGSHSAPGSVMVTVDEITVPDESFVTNPCVVIDSANDPVGPGSDEYVYVNSILVRGFEAGGTLTMPNRGAVSRHLHDLVFTITLGAVPLELRRVAP